MSYLHWTSNINVTNTVTLMALLLYNVYVPPGEWDRKRRRWRINSDFLQYCQWSI